MRVFREELVRSFFFNIVISIYFYLCNRNYFRLKVLVILWFNICYLFVLGNYIKFLNFLLFLFIRICFFVENLDLINLRLLI